jgi:hypothetical protein
VTAFSQSIAQAARIPDAVVYLGPDAFATSWPRKPVRQTAAGLLLLSEKDVSICRAEAAKKANELHPEGPGADPVWNDAYNDELMAWALSRSLCCAEDAETPFFAVDGQDEDVVQMALVPSAIRHLWDELERATITKSPVRREATDEEMEDLGQMLKLTGMLATPQQKRIRKLCSFLLDELAPLAGFEDDDGLMGSGDV